MMYAAKVTYNNGMHCHAIVLIEAENNTELLEKFGRLYSNVTIEAVEFFLLQIYVDGAKRATRGGAILASWEEYDG